MTTMRESGVLLRDVTLRDGLQLTGKLLPTARKLEIIRFLLDIGVPELEIGSLARADLVPPMANTVEVIEGLTDAELARCWVWVATPWHVEKAAAAGARNFQYCFSVSDAHNQANIARSTEASLDAMPAATAIARSIGGRIQLCLATSFTCPFDGPVPERKVLGILTDARTEGADDIVLCDTVGQAIPAQIASLVEQAKRLRPECRIIFHGHDTWGMGVANAMAAIGAGADVVDGALGGLGGCPFAPGASGNTATEDLLFATRPHALTPPAFGRVVRVSEQLLAELGEPPRSKAAQGARSRARAFEWVITEPGFIH
ncbi:hydroxymethylglutaryl-CoA lyase [Amycolatopsis pithecellobii]|uniref:Hydroxymethylglutaryl-CoA lyase n=1 Tax=Amycolatopsis pithecellobii TaxID=664692 RepID=A0A6N7YZB2_9PSEU|nr:hydroxymethylglutaryl-CoA lyase [Amycolatopsis pithecellobii]MTD52530.1 hydroxymethylglutaryl-CoA lyase [Amycolatopsis pithecellobii]